MNEVSTNEFVYAMGDALSRQPPSIPLMLALWKALRGRGIPDILLDLIVALHENTSVRVRLGKQLSDPLPTTSGVRQGCVLAPVLRGYRLDTETHEIQTRSLRWT